MCDEGHTVQHILALVGRTDKTIRNWLRRFGEGEPGMKPRDKPGRSRTTTVEQDQAMVEVSQVCLMTGFSHCSPVPTREVVETVLLRVLDGMHIHNYRR